uniref:Macro domain-containing protein n=1 Tax=Myripristis murdjan TaxID=586833 RepID=A0A667WEG1_9TELE
MASSVQLHPDEGRVLVKGFILDQSSQNSLVQKTVTIDLPRNTTVATYYLDSGLQVVVCQGDITKEHADALVNAANEDLNHVGGVAAALSRAGGAQVQTESSTLVKQVGKIPTGDVVVTTGGNLNCYKLLHAVGPVQGRAGGRERELLEKAVCSVLNLAEMMEFQSIAIPCISSGTYGVPIRVCTEAIRQHPLMKLSQWRAYLDFHVAVYSSSTSFLGMINKGQPSR